MYMNRCDMCCIKLCWMHNLIWDLNIFICSRPTFHINYSVVHWTPQVPGRFRCFLFTNMHSRLKLILFNDYRIDSYKNITQKPKYLLRLSTHTRFSHYSAIQGVKVFPIFLYLLKCGTNQSSWEVYTLIWWDNGTLTIEFAWSYHQITEQMLLGSSGPQKCNLCKFKHHPDEG